MTAQAEEAPLRSRLTDAEVRGDTGAEREAALDLARYLVRRGRAQDEAIALGMRALDLRRDAHTSLEVSGWLEGLGDHERAAELLRPLVGEDAESETLLVRIGTLAARAGNVAAAAQAFRDASQKKGASAIGLELLGALGAWAPDTVPPQEAARAYLEAAERRGGADVDGYEDLLRAFEAAPWFADAATGVARRLRLRSPRHEDEIVRTQAEAMAAEGKDEAARIQHLERLQRALADSDLPRAFVAAFDAGVDGELFPGSLGAAFDELLLRVGATEMLAARLEYRGRCGATAPERVRALARAARLVENTAGDLPRAVEFYRTWYQLDPSADEARAALETYKDIPFRAPPESLLRLYGYLAEREMVRVIHTANEMAQEGRISLRMAGALWIAGIVARDFRTEFQGLSLLVGEVPDECRAAILASVALRAQRKGDGVLARTLAESACQIAPGFPRAVVALADRSVGTRDRTSASAIELAVRTVGPRARWAAAISESLSGLDEHAAAVSWSQQAVALRPGDLALTVALLSCAARAKDPPHFAEALLWALSQPFPRAQLVDVTARGLEELLELDARRAVAVARRALDILGPEASLRGSLRAIAERGGSPDLAALVSERYATNPENRRAELDRLALEARERGDVEAEAFALVRRVRLGGSSPDILRRLRSIEQASPSRDALLWVLEARALALSTDSTDVADPGTKEVALSPSEMGDEDLPTPSDAWRALAQSRWTLAGDKRGALEAWRQAVLTASTGSAAREAARAALSLSEPRAAFELGALGLRQSPEHTDALEFTERGAFAADLSSEMSLLYEDIAGLAFGRFGQRGAHYRAARVFELHGDVPRALKHAVSAFEIAPAEGATLALLQRVASASQDRSAAVRVVVQVAEASTDRSQRARWLLRASEMAPNDEEGARMKVDALLRAALQFPDSQTVTKLREESRRLLKLMPSETDGLHLRVGNAVQALSARVDGPDGARLAITLAAMIFELFGDAPVGLAALEKAFSADADLDEYDALVPLASAMARSKEAGPFLERVVAVLEKPYANFGTPAIALLARMAEGRRDHVLSDRLWVAAAERRSEDPALVLRAMECLERLQDPSLRARFDKSIPRDEQLEALRVSARRMREDGAPHESLLVWEKLICLQPDDDEASSEIDGLCELLGEHELKAKHLMHRAERMATTNPEGSRALRLRVVALLEQRLGRTDLARGELEAILVEWPEHAASLRYLADLLDAMGEAEAAAPIWKRLSAAVEGPESRTEAEMHEAAALTKANHLENALGVVTEVLEREPGNAEALEREAELFRAMGRTAEQGNALEALAKCGASTVREAAKIWMQAAECAKETGDRERAVARAQRALDLDANLPGPSLLLEELKEPVVRAEVDTVLDVVTEVVPQPATDVEVQAPTDPGVLSPIPEAPPTPVVEVSVPRRDLRELRDELAHGSYEAGEAILREGVGTGEAVRVRYTQAMHAPGELGRLHALREAASQDGDAPLIAAIDHVFRAFGVSPVAAPLLSAQGEQPGMLGLLNVQHPMMEVFSILWESAAPLFVKEVPPLVDVEPIVAGGVAPLSRLYELAIRLLDLPRIPLLVPLKETAEAATGPIRSEVSVRLPPSVLLSGDVREDGVSLRRALGTAVSGALPPHVLLLGLREAPLAAAWAAVRQAYGPTGRPQEWMDALAARFAESFWNTIPPQRQRRVQDLLGEYPHVSLAELVAKARQAGRRTALFLTGDFGDAVRAFLAEKNVPPPTNIEALRSVCEMHSEIADLYALAVSPEFAHGRWVVPVQRASLVGRFGAGS